MFWFQHPEVLVKNFDLWPLAYMSFNNKLNAISRLVILLSVLGFAYTKNTRILIAGVKTLGVIIFLHHRGQNSTYHLYRLQISGTISCTLCITAFLRF